MASISHRFAGKACSSLEGFALTWSRGEVQTCAIGIIAQIDGVRLVYSLANWDGGTTQVDELVPFAYTPTRFGGRRQWLTCLKVPTPLPQNLRWEVLPMPAMPRPRVRLHPCAGITSEPSIVPTASESGWAVIVAQ